MSNFGAKLAELLERKRMLQSEFSRVSGINDAQISRWVNGQQRFIDPLDLEKVCIHISQSPKDRAELVRSHLLDELPAVGSELIDIRIKGLSALQESPPAYRTTLPLPIQRAIETLGQEAVTDADVRQVILGLAQMLETSRQNELIRMEDKPSSSSGQTAARADASTILATYGKSPSGRKKKTLIPRSPSPK